VHRRALSKQSLQGQVSVKLTPEICINNAASNSRLEAAGRQATAKIPFTELSPDSFFLSLSPYLMRKQPNYTCMLKNLLKLYCIELGTFCGVFFVQFCSTLYIPFDETTTEQHQRHHIKDWRLRWTQKLLRLKLYCI
jgi:hypothetical protein